jgi:hypothetical protein
MVKKKQWRTRTRGTRKQKGVHFVIDDTSTQTKKVRLPKVTPRDLNVSVTVNLSKEIRERKKRAEEARKPAKEEPLRILDPRTHPLRVHEIEDRIETPLRAPVRVGEAGRVAVPAGYAHGGEGTTVEVGSIHMGEERQPSAIEETGKLLDTASGAMEKRAERAKERRAEKREEKRYREEKAEKAKEKAEKDRKEALERQEKYKKEQEAKKQKEEKAQLRKVKWAKRVEKHSYAKQAQKVAAKEKGKKK